MPVHVGPAVSSATSRLKREGATRQLLETCRERFTEPDYQVESDAGGIVWVKTGDGRRSFGIQPWQLREHSIEEVLERVEQKLSDNPTVSSART